MIVSLSHRCLLVLLEVDPNEPFKISELKNVDFRVVSFIQENIDSLVTRGILGKTVNEESEYVFWIKRSSTMLQVDTLQKEPIKERVNKRRRFSVASVSGESKLVQLLEKQVTAQESLLKQLDLLKKYRDDSLSLDQSVKRWRQVAQDASEQLRNIMLEIHPEGFLKSSEWSYYGEDPHPQKESNENEDPKSIKSMFKVMRLDLGLLNYRSDDDSFDNVG